MWVGKLMSVMPKSEAKNLALRTLYLISAPIIAVPGYEDNVTDDMKQKYQFEAKLNIKEIFEKEEAPDYHALLQLSQSSLSITPSRTFTKIQLQLGKKFFAEKCNFVKEEKLELNEERELLKLKKWIFKKQIEHLKKRRDEN